MSLIRHGFFPRTMFDYDYWYRPLHLDFGPTTLDLFDPFDDLDRHFARNFHWLDIPDFIRDLPPLIPRVPLKHRITLDCRGYNPKSIKTEVKGNKLIITGSEGEKRGASDDYSVKEFKKSYDIPSDAETDKLVSFMTSSGNLVVEIPLKYHNSSSEDIFPRIVDGENGKKSLSMKFNVPRNIDPSKINVTCKDRELIIQAEENTENSDGKSHVYFYRRSTLPENTDFNSLKCEFENNQISVTAKINTDYVTYSRTIPIENRTTRNF